LSFALQNPLNHCIQLVYCLYSDPNLVGTLLDKTKCTAQVKVSIASLANETNFSELKCLASSQLTLIGFN